MIQCYPKRWLTICEENQQLPECTKHNQCPRPLITYYLHSPLDSCVLNGSQFLWLSRSEYRVIMFIRFRRHLALSHCFFEDFSVHENVFPNLIILCVSYSNSFEQIRVSDETIMDHLPRRKEKINDKQYSLPSRQHVRSFANRHRMHPIAESCRQCWP